MNKEEKQRGLELQAYIDSIRDMTIKEIAIKYLKKHHLPKFLASMLVKFSTPLLLAKDYELTELEAQVEKMKNCKNCANYMISGVCPGFYKTGWCKNWEMTRSKK